MPPQKALAGRLTGTVHHDQVTGASRFEGGRLASGFTRLAIASTSIWRPRADTPLCACQPCARALAEHAAYGARKEVRDNCLLGAMASRAAVAAQSKRKHRTLARRDADDDRMCEHLKVCARQVSAARGRGSLMCCRRDLAGRCLRSVPMDFDGGGFESCSKFDHQPSLSMLPTRSSLPPRHAIDTGIFDFARPHKNARLRVLQSTWCLRSSAHRRPP